MQFNLESDSKFDLQFKIEFNLKLDLSGPQRYAISGEY